MVLLHKHCLGDRRTAILLRYCIALLWTVLTGSCGDITGDAGPAVRVARAEQVAQLGRMLFVDTSLSADGRVACATCHRPELAYSDGLPRASGAFGQLGMRNTPSILDVGRQRSLFWDGRRTRLEDQALDPLRNEVEYGLRSDTLLLDKLHADARYDAAFQAAYGVPVARATVQQVADALAAFERTLVSGASPFDRFLAGQRAGMPAAARRGWVVFDQQAHCTRCHVAVSGDGQPSLFTDHQFHSLAIGFRKVERVLPRLTARLAAMHADERPFAREVLRDAELAELGRFAVTLDPRDLGAFKTPGLRNVALTGPYMHDGSVQTLADAVDLELYRGGGRDDRPIILTPSDRDDLVAFLRALSSDAIMAARVPGPVL